MKVREFDKRFLASLAVGTGEENASERTNLLSCCGTNQHATVLSHADAVKWLEDLLRQGKKETGEEKS